jgi:hypothetical protein
MGRCLGHQDLARRIAQAVNLGQLRPANPLDAIP